MRLCRFEKRKCHKICMRIVAVPFCKLRTMWRRIVWKAINFIFEIGRTDSVFFCSSIFVSVEFATAQNALVILCDRAMGRTKIDFSIWILLIWQTKCSKIKVLILLYCLRERKKYGNFVFSMVAQWYSFVGLSCCRGGCCLLFRRIHGWRLQCLFRRKELSILGTFSPFIRY